MTRQQELLHVKIFQEGTNTFAILDGASVPGLQAKLRQWKPEHECLYRGELKPDLAEAAPYLVQLSLGADITNWICSEGWGKHWGVFAITGAPLMAARQHFRRLLTVHDESGKPLLFRFYDPRVLNVYLPTCTAEELSSIFGPVSTYISEDAGAGKLVKFEVKNQALATQTFE